MSEGERIYGFFARALLTEEALDRAGRKSRNSTVEIEHEEIARLVALDSLDEEYVDAAYKMSIVYTAVAAFENSVRELISSTLLEEVGEDWWEKCVPKNS